MASPPASTEFRKTDFPSNGLGSQQALEKFLQQLNPVLRAARTALSGGLTVADNMNAEIKTLTVTTPAAGPFPDGRPYAAYTTAAGQSIASGANVIIQFGTQVADTDNAVTQGPPWKFIVPAGKAGVYRFSAMVTLSGATASDTTVILTTLKNGSEYFRLQRVDANTTQNIGVSGSVDYNLNVGDSVQIALFQNSGVSKTLESVYGWTNWVTVTCLNLAQPAVLSCFPVTVSTKVSQPQGVVLIGCVDLASTPVVPALGGLSWRGVSTTSGGAVQITDLPGLLPGHKYKLTVLVYGG